MSRKRTTKKKTKKLNKTKRKETRKQYETYVKSLLCVVLFRLHAFCSFFPFYVSPNLVHAPAPGNPLLISLSSLISYPFLLFFLCFTSFHLSRFIMTLFVLFPLSFYSDLSRCPFWDMQNKTSSSASSPRRPTLGLATRNANALTTMESSSFYQKARSFNQAIRQHT